VFALLAFACFPVFAQAEDSSGIQYEDAVPTVTGKHPSELSATSSGAKTPNQSSTASGSGSSSGGSSSGKSAGGAATTGNGTGNGQGSPGKGGGIGQGQATQPISPAGETAPTSNDSGSSPLVPILIAILVLAAISLGVVMVRRRRQQQSGPRARDGSASVAPKAS